MRKYEYLNIMLNCLKQTECKVAGNVALHSFGFIEEVGSGLTVVVENIESALKTVRGDFDIFHRDKTKVHLKLPSVQETLELIEVGAVYSSLKTQKRIMPTSMCGVANVVMPSHLARLAIHTIEKSHGSSESLSLLNIFIKN